MAVAFKEDEVCNHSSCNHSNDLCNQICVSLSSYVGGRLSHHTCLLHLFILNTLKTHRSCLDILVNSGSAFAMTMVESAQFFCLDGSVVT